LKYVIRFVARSENELVLCRRIFSATGIHDALEAAKNTVIARMGGSRIERLTIEEVDPQRTKQDKEEVYQIGLWGDVEGYQ